MLQILVDFLETYFDIFVSHCDINTIKHDPDIEYKHNITNISSKKHFDVA